MERDSLLLGEERLNKIFAEGHRQMSPAGELAEFLYCKVKEDRSFDLDYDPGVDISKINLDEFKFIDPFGDDKGKVISFEEFDSHEIGITKPFQTDNIQNQLIESRLMISYDKGALREVYMLLAVDPRQETITAENLVASFSLDPAEAGDGYFGYNSPDETNPAEPSQAIQEEIVNEIKLAFEVGSKQTPATESEEKVLKGPRFDDFREHWHNLKIEELELGVRAYSSLKRAGIDDLGTLVQWDDKKLRTIPNLGDRTRREIAETMEARGVTLGDKRDIPLHVLNESHIPSADYGENMQAKVLYTLMRNAGLRTLRDISQRTERQMTFTPQIGPTSIKLIRDILTEYDLTFAESE